MVSSPTTEWHAATEKNGTGLFLYYSQTARSVTGGAKGSEENETACKQLSEDTETKEL